MGISAAFEIAYESKRVVAAVTAKAITFFQGDSSSYFTSTSKTSKPSKPSLVLKFKSAGGFF